MVEVFTIPPTEPDGCGYSCIGSVVEVGKPRPSLVGTGVLKRYPTHKAATLKCVHWSKMVKVFIIPSIEQEVCGNSCTDSLIEVGESQSSPLDREILEIDSTHKTATPKYVQWNKFFGVHTVL